MLKVIGNPAHKPFVPCHSSKPRRKKGLALQSVESTSAQKSEFGLRKIGNWFVEFKYRKLINDIHSQITNIDPNSPEYIQYAVSLARLFSTIQPIEVEINLQSNRINDIAHSNEACIFIMNHDYQSQDPALLSIFNILLYQTYLEAGKANSCPRPKILINQDILTSKRKKHREIYEALGAVGVDASTQESTSRTFGNLHVMKQILGDFINDKTHVFLFPEGRRSAFKWLDLKQKFQVGIGELVRQAARRKERVKVVPIGFAYNGNKKENQSLGSIYVGEPIYFIQIDKKLFVTTGNITEDIASPAYKQFFYRYDVQENPGSQVDTGTGEQPTFMFVDNKYYKCITDANVPVIGKDVASYVADVLAENLQICRSKAIDMLPTSSLGKEVTYY